MSAEEVIEQIRALPPEERKQVIDFVTTTEARIAAATARAAKSKPDWDRIINEVFDEHDELFRKLAQYEAAHRTTNS
jgi:hypothetical protein